MIFYQYFLMQKRGHLTGPLDLLADIYVQFCCYMRWDLTQIAGEDNSPRLIDNLPFSGGVQQQRRDAEAPWPLMRLCTEQKGRLCASGLFDRRDATDPRPRICKCISGDAVREV